MNSITLWSKINTIGTNNIRIPVLYGIFKRGVRFNANRKPFENEENLDNEPERVVKVAVIGVPNAGKSTLINSIIERRVCATSSKVHTTRGVSKGICSEGKTQIVFLDTPGLVTDKEKKRYKLEESFVNSFKSCMNSADTVCVVHDASNSWTRDKLDYKVRKLLEKYPEVPSVLVLNKVDLLKSKRVLLDLTKILTEGKLSNKHIRDEISKEERFKANFDSENNDELVDNKTQKKTNDKNKPGWPHFSNVFMVSSTEEIGLDSLKEYLISVSRPSSWLYDCTQHSDLNNEQIITQAVRAKLLDFMPQEIPYNLKTEMEYYKEADNGSITASIVVTCPNRRIQQLLEGAEGGKLRQITTYVTKDLRDAFYQPVNIVITSQCPIKETKK